MYHIISNCLTVSLSFVYGMFFLYFFVLFLVNPIKFMFWVNLRNIVSFYSWRWPQNPLQPVFKSVLFTSPWDTVFLKDHNRLGVF